MKILKLKNAIALFVMTCLLTISTSVFAQTPPVTPPGPGNGTGPNPDNTVPFDGNMTLLFLVAAVAFGVFIVKRRMQKAQPAVTK